MEFVIRVDVPDARRHDEQFREIIDRLKRIETREKFMAKDLDLILADLQDETAVDQSVILLLNKISDLLTKAGNDPAKVKAVRDLIASNKAAFVAAVVANTPAAALTVSPSPVSVAVGGTQQLAVSDAGGADITASAKFSSSDETIATVDASGVVSGVLAGAATISVSDADGNVVSVSVTVA